MAQQLSPWLEGAYGWSFGEGGWNSGMDQNLLKFSFMFDRNVDSIVASLPAAVNGQAHYLTTDNRLYFAVGTTYFSTPVPRWFTVAVRGTGAIWQYNGTALVQIDSPQQLDTRIDAVEITVSTLGSAAFQNTEFFAEQSELDIAVANASNYTDSLRQQLSDSADPAMGASLIGWLRGVTGAIGAKLSAFLSWGEFHAFEFLTVSEIAAVRAGTAGDMRAKLQLALDAAAGGTLRINAGLWQMTPLPDDVTVGLCLDVPSNTKVVFDAGASIELTAHNNTIYQMIRVWERENVTIEYPKLDGRRDLNAAVSGEFGMGIDVRASNNVHIIDPVTDNTWGDGIYVGMVGVVSSSNLTIDNPHADNCRRQGMSIVSVSNVTVNNPVWTNISGTAPAAGLDIEPNGNDAVLEGIRINNPHTASCAFGILIELGVFAGVVDKSIDIEIIGHRDTGSTNGYVVSGLDTAAGVNAVHGSIVSSDPVWVSSGNQAFVAAEHDNLGPTVRVVRPTVIDCNRNAQVSAKYGSAFVVLRDDGSVKTYPIGNVVIDRPVIINRTGTTLKPFYFDSTTQDNTFVKNCFFLNPIRLEGLASNSGGFFALGNYSDEFISWVHKLGGSTTINANNASPLEFADAASNITLAAGAFLRGAPDIIIRKPNNTNTHNVIGPAAGAFIGLGGTVTQLRSSTADSYLRLRPMGADKFLVVDRVGLWADIV